jgi:hypothetical protein
MIERIIKILKLNGFKNKHMKKFILEGKCDGPSYGFPKYTVPIMTAFGIQNTFISGDDEVSNGLKTWSRIYYNFRKKYNGKNDLLYSIYVPKSKALIAIKVLERAGFERFINM